jgi:hypothetical protein
MGAGLADLWKFQKSLRKMAKSKLLRKSAMFFFSEIALCFTFGLPGLNFKKGFKYF